MISITTNITQFIGTEIKRYEKINRDATYAATRKVARSAKTHASQVIRQTYNIKKKDLDKNIIVKNPDSNFVSEIYVAKGKESLPLVKFGNPKQKAAGVEVEVKRGHKVLLKNTFIAVMKSGHKGIFDVPGKKKKAGSKFEGIYQPLPPQVFPKEARLPIKEKYSKAAAHIVTKTVFNSIKIFVKEKFPVVFAQEFKFRANK